MPRPSSRLGLILTVAAAAAAVCTANEMTLRMYQGVVAYLDNPDGLAMTVAIDVRDWNLVENGPREVLFKVYDPDGRPVVREVIEDDGVSGDPYLPEAGGWDHEMWYYALCYGRGSRPMLRWSAFTEPSRVSTLPVRTFTFPLPAGKPGVCRVVAAGSRDHLITLRVDPDLRWAIGGHASWLHGHGDLFKRAYVYVPRGTTGLHLGLAEFDQPVTRRLTITAPDGKQLWDGPATGGFRQGKVQFAKDQYDDQLLTIDVSAGRGDYMMHVQLSRSDGWIYRGKGGVPALFAPDEETARRLRGGALYHDGKVYWHPFQVRFHDWLAGIDADAFVVRDADGNVIEPTEGKAFGWGARAIVYQGLAQRPGFIPLNGQHEPPPLSDSLMYSYSAHHHPAVLNVALRDLAKGLSSLTVGDMAMCSEWNGNFGYMFATYGWHFWRPAWRVLQASEAPAEVKEIVREAMILAGDRLAFGRGVERVNGNAFSHIPMALQYAAAATEDVLQRRLADEYFERFANGGWGRGAGIGRSGDCQEHFGHDFHYGSYILANYRAVTADLGVPAFAAVVKRVAKLYSYLYCADANAYVWGARTHQGASPKAFQQWGFDWQGQPGPPFTISVNDGDEWFAARRPTYYAVTFHGQLAPSWLDYYFDSRLGYGGGALCQLTVPGHGTVLASTLNGSYGKKMQRADWRQFHIHSIVGTMATGEPLVAADSIHPDARLEGTVVSSSGEVRDRPIHCLRSYTFEDAAISCRAALADTDYRMAYWNQGPPSKVAEAYEMIPFVPRHQVSPKDGAGKKETVLTTVTGQLAGELVGELTAAAVEADLITVDCGGYGVRIELAQALPVSRGPNQTIMLALASAPTDAAEIAVQYRIVPFIEGD